MSESNENFHPDQIVSAPAGSDPSTHVERTSLLALYKVISLEDEQFRFHMDRTADLSLELAIAKGLAPAKQERVWFSGLLHDIGKMGVDRRILSKTGHLAPGEIEDVRNHTRIGHEILGAVRGGIYGIAAEVALRHHERWDGKGYPDGIPGREIPLEARIVAVADVFDCITAGRPYREARSPGEASEELHRFAGTQFDPELVELFLSEVLPNVSSG